MITLHDEEGKIEEVCFSMKLPTREWSMTLTCRTCGQTWETDFRTMNTTTAEHAPDCAVGLLIKDSQGSVA